MSSGLLTVLAVFAAALALNAAALIMGFRKLRRAGPGIGRAVGWVMWIGLTAFSVCGVLGVAVGMVKAFGAVGGESIEPSQKARILGEGISEAMSLTALGVVLLLPLAIGVLIGAAVIRRRTAK